MTKLIRIVWTGSLAGLILTVLSYCGITAAAGELGIVIAEDGTVVASEQEEFVTGDMLGVKIEEDGSTSDGKDDNKAHDDKADQPEEVSFVSQPEETGFYGPLYQYNRFSVAHQIQAFPCILQMPELPTGCEVVALTMVLQYYGFDVDKITMATEYLPISNDPITVGPDGRRYGPDLKNYFWGNPFSNGTVCGTGAIVTAAERYINEQDSLLYVYDISGARPEELYTYVAQDIPVIVLVTIGMRDRGELDGWYTKDGSFVDWAEDDHGAVLIGYSPNTVTLADPISGIITYSKQLFEKIYAQRGYGSVVIR
ncbi:MAG: C39 family peptidase [Blautia sp.]|nr:C39 family peptidase [Blautia sp.]